MIDLLKVIGITILGFIIFIAFIVFGIMPFDNSCPKGETKIEYEDLNGNIGIATKCQYTDSKGFHGGMGQPICFVGNKVIAVKWYEDKTEYMNCFKNLLLGSDEE